MKRRNKSDQIELERYERNFPYDKPRLREIVFVSTWCHNQPGFSLLLTRVPVVAEQVEHEGLIYRITGVTNYPVNSDGRARFGWHAMIDLELVPEEVFEKPKRQKQRSQG
jgi:hypothetical protein